MLIIPAIDLKDQQCVRLRQGRMEDSTVFSDDPVAMAKHWQALGARRLHIVDLNGAFAGLPVNLEIITAIAKACPDLQIQLGGGIRSLETIETYLKAGIHYVIIGTQAVKQPEFVEQACGQFAGHIMVGLDAKGGKVAINGWAEVLDSTAHEWVARFSQVGISGIIYTDIGRDGMLQGLNVEATEALARGTDVPVIASGGLTDLADIEALCKVRQSGIAGVIAGRAIYEGTMDLTQAQQFADAFNR